MRQRGQALALALLLIGVLGLAFVQYAGLAQVAADKVRQQHALDAAAYSGALVQARALNLISYANRAQLGHQVAMAHLTALGAWAGFGNTQAGQLIIGNPPPHLIGLLFGPSHGQAYLASSAASGMPDNATLMSLHGEHDRVVHDVLQAVQQRVADSLVPMRRHAMLAVLARSHALDASVMAARLDVLQDDWPGYVRQYAASSTFIPFLRKVQQQYPFLSPRHHTATNAWPVQARCPWMRHELRRQGETRLDDSGHWQSFDTQSFHALRANRWIGCYYREYPMAWAWVPQDVGVGLAVPHVPQPPDDFSTQDFWRWVQANTQWRLDGGSDNPLASSRAVAQHQRWAGRGLGQYTDVDGARRDQGTGFQLRLRMPHGSGRTIVTRSAAMTEFILPPSSVAAGVVGAGRQAHLFLPYWQARLAPEATP